MGFSIAGVLLQSDMGHGCWHGFFNDFTYIVLLLADNGNQRNEIRIGF